MIRHLKWLIALAALLIVPLSSEGTASAATNCSMQNDNIHWTGYLSFTAWASNCTNTEKVEFSASGPGGAAGLLDLTIGAYVYGYNNSGIVYNVNPYTGYAGNQFYDVISYCHGQVHTVEPYYNFRLKSDIYPGNWGPWHVHYGYNQTINC